MKQNDPTPMCPLCDNPVDGKGTHTCNVAEIFCAMSPTSGISRKGSCLSRSFNSRCSISSESSRISKSVTWQQESVTDTEGCSEHTEGSSQQELLPPPLPATRVLGERVRTLCPLAGRCKSEVAAQTDGRITKVRPEEGLFEISTDMGVVIIAEPQDFSVIGFLPPKSTVLTTAPLTLTSEDLTLQFPIGTRAVIQRHNLEKNTVYLKFAAGPCCDLCPSHVIPCKDVPQKGFFSRLLPRRASTIIKSDKK